MSIRFGRRYITEQCAELVTADGGRLTLIDVVNRYLGVYFTRGCSLRCCLEEAKYIVSLGRLSPFSVKRAAAHPNL